MLKPEDRGSRIHARGTHGMTRKRNAFFSDFALSADKNDLAEHPYRGDYAMM
jgi:hypothetical protein